MKTYYITTPIYYSSGRLTIGHCYTTVICDCIARFKRMDGYETFYLTGTDEHGQKVEEIAKKNGVTPKEYVDGLHKKIVDLWKLLNINYDKFIRTTDTEHEKCVQLIFRQLLESGYLYKNKYEGLYCTPCESFWTESQLVDGKCPDCGREVHHETEEGYFFKLSAFADKLMELYAKEPKFIYPKSRMNEMVNNFIKPGLKDLCVTRTSFSWGVPLDFDPKHVAYVWIDALINYISALGYGTDDDSLYQKFWPADVHMVGKEITRFHSIIWPAVLMALNLPLPKQVYGHGYLNFDNDRMSKSKGNVVYPEPLCEKYGVDSVRYYLLREIPFGSDGNYTNSLFINRYNADLCNNLGNLVSRVTAMVAQYKSGKVPSPKTNDPEDVELTEAINGLYKKVEKHMDDINPPEALSDIFALISRANKYIDETSPWVLAKNAESADKLDTVLYNLCESIRISALCLAPFIPETSQKIFDKLNIGQIPELFGDMKVGYLYKNTVEKGDALFVRLNLEKELKELDLLQEQK